MLGNKKSLAFTHNVIRRVDHKVPPIPNIANIILLFAMYDRSSIILIAKVKKK
jgi:hypothetical protein